MQTDSLEFHFQTSQSQAMALSFYHTFGEQDSRLFFSSYHPIYLTITTYLPQANGQFIKKILLTTSLRNSPYQFSLISIFRTPHLQQQVPPLLLAKSLSTTDSQGLTSIQRSHQLLKSMVLKLTSFPAHLKATIHNFSPSPPSPLQFNLTTLPNNAS